MMVVKVGEFQKEVQCAERCGSSSNNNEESGSESFSEDNAPPSPGESVKPAAPIKFSKTA